MLEKMDRVSPVDALMRKASVIPVLVVEDALQAVPLAQALVAGGVPVLEITLRSAAALDAIRRISQAVPAAIVGAGTVLNPAQFAAAQMAGARFVIAPGATESLYAAAKDTDLPFIPAVATASEIMRGLEHGFARFKFFPAESSGGIAALKNFHGPFPDIRFCPTGGVSEANLAAYAGLANVFAVGGSWLAPKDKVMGGDWAAITAIAERAVAAVRAAKKK